VELVNVSFQESVTGAKKNIAYNVTEDCSTCKGSGCKPGTKLKKCTTCNGTGHESVSHGFMNVVTTCSTCDGQGQMIKTPCSSCHGSGSQQSKKTVEVKIPAGVFDGLQMQIRGRGHAGINNGPNGNLILKMRVMNNPTYERHGESKENVFSTAEINVTQAILGGTVRIPALRGDVDLKIPKGCQPGHRVKLREKGFVVLNSSRKGDHYVTFKVKIPTTLSEKQMDLIKQFEDDDDALKMDKDKSVFDKIKNKFC